MLHNHVDLRLGTLFREHTTLGETFEYALKRVVGESNPALVQELRLQFGASIDAVCDELEQDDQLTAEAPLEPTSKETRVQPKKRKRHHPVQLTAALHELSGFRGTFHYQTTSDTTLRTPVKDIVDNSGIQDAASIHEGHLRSSELVRKKKVASRGRRRD